MDKYYTPSKEEFHVGFEYELNDMSNNSRKDKWIPTIWGDEFISLIGKENTLQLWARVKYLDKEDIESLGWVPTKVEKQFSIIKKNDSITEKYYLNFNDKISIIRADENARWVCFDGNIKNKNELKTIMKQTGI